MTAQSFELLQMSLGKKCLGEYVLHSRHTLPVKRIFLFMKALKGTSTQSIQGLFYRTVDGKIKYGDLSSLNELK